MNFFKALLFSLSLVCLAPMANSGESIKITRRALLIGAGATLAKSASTLDLGLTGQVLPKPGFDRTEFLELHELSTNLWAYETEGPFALMEAREAVRFFKSTKEPYRVIEVTKQELDSTLKGLQSGKLHSVKDVIGELDDPPQECPLSLESKGEVQNFVLVEEDPAKIKGQKVNDQP